MLFLFKFKKKYVSIWCFPYRFPPRFTSLRRPPSHALCMRANAVYHTYHHTTATHLNLLTLSTASGPTVDNLQFASTSTYTYTAHCPFSHGLTTWGEKVFPLGHNLLHHTTTSITITTSSTTQHLLELASTSKPSTHSTIPKAKPSPIAWPLRYQTW